MEGGVSSAASGAGSAPGTAAPVEARAEAYSVGPSYAHKFKASQVKLIIHKCLRERLEGKKYHPDDTSQWSRDLADEIKVGCKELGLARYKLIVQVLIGEQRGAGIHFAARNFWDPNTDAYAQESYANESLYASASVFGTYTY